MDKCQEYKGNEVKSGKESSSIFTYLRLYILKHLTFAPLRFKYTPKVVKMSSSWQTFDCKRSVS